MSAFEKYFKSLQDYSLDEITKHSHRNSLQQLLENLAGPKIKILHEPKREGKFGSPDFKITKTESIVGYVENKKIEESLDKILKSVQLKKYQTLSDNILLTNYTEWILIKEGKVDKRETLCFKTDIENKKVKLDPAKVAAVEKLIHRFFSQAPKQISDAKKLAEALAIRAKLLKEFLEEELVRQENEHTEGRLYQLYETFKKYVFHELTINEFSDAFAQNLVYGLFLARLNADKKIDLNNAWDYIPATFELIKELVDFLKELKRNEYRETKWIVEEVLTILNNLDLKSIQESLSFVSGKKRKDSGDWMGDKDPYVYFYEDFLKAYDKKLREAKGVYYTPPPVVNFIVRAIDDILVNTFGIKDGLADRSKVTVLDFATGTGTFLVEVLQQIFDKLPKSSGKKELYVKEHILKNIYGFEYLIAPYTIAHLKLSQFLKDNDYELQPKDRLQIFLTNTLEPIDVQEKIPFLPALTEESKNAQRVKDQPILVITGNPPYNVKSKNKGKWILDRIKVYKEGLKEKKNNLGDDYIKFIRFAEWKLENLDRGIIGIITNNSFYDGITHRQMRKHLLKGFDSIYCLNLHGSLKRKEKSPDGSKDDNVFDIEPGVAITFFIKEKLSNKNSEKLAKLFYADLFGTRNTKYKTLLSSSVTDLGFVELFPKEPHYFFTEKDLSQDDLYKSNWVLTDIFSIFNSGVKTDRDPLFVDFEEKNLSQRMKILLSKKFDSHFAEKYKVVNSSSYKILSKIKDKEFNSSKIIAYDYRPFDKRLLYYDEEIISRPGYSTMENLLTEKNVALVTCRQQSTFDFQHAFITKNIADCCFISSQTKEFGYVFPLYDIKRNKANFNPKFKTWFNKHYKYEFSDYQIFSYIYAILNSPSYRNKYSELLKICFPRIPFTKDEEVFEQLANLGDKLLHVHLMEGDAPDYPYGMYLGKGSHIIEKPRFVFEKGKGKLFINESQWFDTVPSAVYNFYIGGYQVLDKYLKERKGRNILDESEHIERIIKTLAFTIDQMKKIDELTKNWI